MTNSGGSRIAVRTRAASTIAAVLGCAALVGCAASAGVGGDGPTEQSVAVLDEFFGHLAAGEAAEAAALTGIDFHAEFIDDGFYAASPAKPTRARVLEASGDDGYSVTATVEYVLDDPKHPVTADFTVKNDEGRRTVSWSGADGFALIMVSSPGHIVLNDELEFPMSSDAHDLTLLPGLYEVSYADPTGTTRLDAEGVNEFTLSYPVADEPPASEVPEKVAVSASFLQVNAFVDPEVITAVGEEIAELTAACTEEELAGPSCPPSVLEYGHTLADPSTVEWFRDVHEEELVVEEGAVHYSMGFTVRADDKTFPVPAVYEGTVTRDEDGAVTYTRTG